MKSELLTDALNYLDDELLEKAALLRMRPARKHISKKIHVLYGSLAAAACLCLMLTASFVLNGFLFRCGSSSSDNAPKEFSGNSAETQISSDYSTNAADGLEPEPAAGGVSSFFFDAVISELHENCIVVEPVAESGFLSQYDRIEVFTGEISTDGLQKLTAGKTVRIFYDGTILESAPPQIKAAAIYDIGASGAAE